MFLLNIHTTYECPNIRVYRDTSRRASDFFEIRVWFDHLPACFRCDKLCSFLCCVYIYSFSSFIFITMDRKKVCKKSSAKKKMMIIELKREIIENMSKVFELLTCRGSMAVVRP